MRKMTEPVAITLAFGDWCLLIGVLSSIIESSIETQDPVVSEQVQQFARIRENIDRATD